MQTDRTQLAVDQIDSVLQSYTGLKRVTGNLYRGRVASQDTARFITAAMACIQRITGTSSTYALMADSYINNERITTVQWDYPIEPLMGILMSLKSDIESGYMESFVSQVHADMFADFLESAEHLLHEDGKGYKDAAAVLAGGVLEQHLRQLCDKYEVDTERTTDDGKVVARKADALNADLAKQDAYGKLDQKNVTAWLDLRNSAAHAKYDDYTKAQVAFLIQSLRDFIARNPA